MLTGFFAALLLLGCSGSEDARPTPTPSAQAVALAETPESAPTAALQATPTSTATIEPAPSATPTPTATAAPPAPIASPVAPPAPTAAPSPAPSYEPITLTVTARSIEFMPASLTIPAHVAVTLVMDNQDSGVLHDLGVNVVGGGRTETCKGPCKSSFVFAAHVPGSYHFFCSLHPEMVGDLRVIE